MEDDTSAGRSSDWSPTYSEAETEVEEHLPSDRDSQSGATTMELPSDQDDTAVVEQSESPAASSHNTHDWQVHVDVDQPVMSTDEFN